MSILGSTSRTSTTSNTQYDETGINAVDNRVSDGDVVEGNITIAGENVSGAQITVNRTMTDYGLVDRAFYALDNATNTTDKAFDLGEQYIKQNAQVIDAAGRFAREALEESRRLQEGAIAAASAASADAVKRVSDFGTDALAGVRAVTGDSYDFAKDIAQDAFKISTESFDNALATNEDVVSKSLTTAGNAIQAALGIKKSEVQDENARTVQFLIVGVSLTVVAIVATMMIRGKK
jgi:hypothetical protein